MTNTRLSNRTEFLLKTFRKECKKRIKTFPAYPTKDFLIGYALWICIEDLNGK